MKPITLRILLLLSLYLPAQSISAQKHFNLTVKLPEGINPQSIEAWLDNGKEVKQIKAQSTATGLLVFAGNYYSLYAAINLQNTPEEKTLTFGQTFFVREKPAIVTIHETGSETNAFKNYTLKNALDFKEEKKQLDAYTIAEREKASAYERQYGDKIFSGNDTVVRNQYFKVLMPALRRKKLEYIVKHPGSYYSFYTFRTEVARTAIFPADSLFSVFNSFPETFKYSDEGNYLHAFLHGRLPVQHHNAIDFTTKDIHQKTVRLSQFKGKKMVLLHFWATWCTPCMRELPALKQISNQYKGDELQIISIALPSVKYADYLATLSKYQMNWIHVYNNPDLINKYGNAPTPRFCLIDQTGMIIYDGNGTGSSDDYQLGDLQKKLEEVMND